jgi:DNA (cytosine-5)-methyltransferase 1
MIGMSICSGIGAPEVAAPWIDWRWQSEIEPFPAAVLAHRFPDAVNLGDMTKFQEWPDATVDVLVGGTPCQSFSVAGLRKGLDDPRGNLMLTYLAIARRYRPRWLVWENVPGVLSSNGGRDFGAFLRGLGECGYGFAYRVLDAQYVRTPRFPRAVPQRRRRVFVVGHLGDWRRAAAVLFDAESMSGHPAPRREAGQRPAHTISARPTGGGGLGTDFDCDGGLIAAPVSSTLNAAFGEKQGLEDQHINSGAPLFVAHSLRGEGFDASEDCTGRGTPLVPVAIQERAVSENPDVGPGGKGWNDDGAAYALEARHHVQAVAFGAQNSAAQGDDMCEQFSPPLTTTRTPAVAFDLNQITSKINQSKPDPAVHHTLPATSCPPHLATPYAVRRLTPTECERLQGFPDDWTKISYRNKPAEQCPDGPRYKALGNSMAINCMEFIFERLRWVDENFPMEATE